MTEHERLVARTDAAADAWALAQPIIDGLKAQLEQARQDAEESEAKHRTYMRHAGAELEERAATILDLSQKHSHQLSAARRSAAALVLTLQALDNLLKALTGSNMEDAQRFFPGEVFRAMQDASEVIKAHGIPF